MAIKKAKPTDKPMTKSKIIETLSEETGVSKKDVGNVLNTMAELAYAVEWSDDLNSAWSTDGVSEEVTADDGTLQTVVATLPAGAENRRFVHLKVVRPAP